MNIDLAAQDDERELLRLKDSMSDQQRNDMSEIIQNELKRREGLAKSNPKGARPAHKSSIKSSRMSSPIDSNDLEGIYKDSDKNIQELRVRSLEKRLQEAKREVSRLGAAGKKLPKKSATSLNQTPKYSFAFNRMPAILMLVLVLGFASHRYFKDKEIFGFLESGNVIASNNGARASLGQPVNSLNENQSKFVGNQSADLNSNTESEDDSKYSFSNISSPIERGLLMQLDSRRVELEKRKQILDEKEGELKIQAKLVSEKVAELKTLISKLSTIRKEKDHKYSARMEQLASVYSVMAPQDAANLIGKLDDDVALGLLERMPGKRMAQILGLMNQDRALELTKSLTNKREL